MTQNFHIGEAIRRLRQERNLTGGQLGKKAGLSQSKISKIETGAQPNLKPDEIEKILNILQAPQIIRQQVKVQLGLSETKGQGRYWATYSPDNFNAMLDLERVTQELRLFSNGLIPALLQTLEYRQALHAQFALAPQAIQASMRTIVKRQDLLWDTRRHFHFILVEAALYNAPASRVIQLGQLDRVSRFIDLRQVKVGIIPLEAGLTAVDNVTFVLLDKHQLIQALPTADIISRNPDEIAAHFKIFNSLIKLADYGDAARAHVRKAMDYFG